MTTATPCSEPEDRSERRRFRALVAVLAFVAYVPLLLTASGQVSADTKTFLYLDPGLLLRRAVSVWNTHIALGYVPHQNVGYLWPMGPWYWMTDALGLPDWVAQRLWWGTLLFAAGAGVVALLRRFRWRSEAIAAAALLYMMTPYVLSVIARLSAMLIPYAALPWLLLLAMMAVRTGGWRHPALFALLAATAGSVNLTALLLVGLAPAAWVAYSVWGTREVSWRAGAAVAARIGVLTALASAWWLSGLAVQAGYGNDVLRYSETAEAVATTSSASEVLRGLGYWFFYGDDRLGPWIEPSVLYTQRPWLLALTYALPAVALAAAAIGRWRARPFFIALVTIGLLVAVGPYPWNDPPPLGRAIQAVLLTERGLAMRSLPRAAPVLVLGLAALLAAGLTAVYRRWPRQGRVVAGLVAVGFMLAQVPHWTRGTVPENLRRPEDVPQYWVDAAARIDEGDHGTRAIEIPGSDFASYRWGNTVDPITSGIVVRDVAYRELIPLGPPESAAMLDALDLPLQEHTMSPLALAPIVRLMRGGDLVVRSDLQFERYNTPRPKNLWALIESAPGFGSPDEFGPGDPNRPVAEAALDDELWLLTDADLVDPPEVAVVPVEDPVPMLSAHAAARPLVVAGDASALVDVAAAGLIDGTEHILLSASLGDDDLETSLRDDGLLVITDGNRRRGQRWSTVRHTKGYTEPAGFEALEVDHSDNRLPILDEQGDDGRTVAVHRGDMTANATSYGNRITFEPSFRPANAVDGDPRTAWRTGGFEDATGERLELHLDEPVTTDRIRFLQPITGSISRHVTQVRLHFDDEESIDVDLDPSSNQQPGQLVTFEPRTFQDLDVELLEDDSGDPPRYTGRSALGFAEIRIGDTDDLVLEEWIRTPVDLLRRAGDRAADRPLALVLTRLWQDPTDTTRDDEERQLARLVEVDGSRSLVLTGTARVSARASDEVIDAALGRGGDVTVTSTGRLLGSRAEVGAAALDGDPTTAWMSPRTAPTGHGLDITLSGPTSFDHLDLQVVADGRHSVPTRLDVWVDGGAPVPVEIPAIDDLTQPDAVARVRVPLPASMTGSRISVRVTDARRQEVIDWAARKPVAQPVSIAELGLPGVSVPPLDDAVPSGCRDDLLTIDGEPVAIRISGSTDDALAGSGLAVTTCDGAPIRLGEGEHAIESALGLDLGWDLDQLALRSDGAAAGTTLLAAAGGADAPPSVAVRDESATRYVIDLEGEPGDEVTFVLGQSFNLGWSATADGTSLGEQQLTDGFANGWRVTLGEDGTAHLELRFEPQRLANWSIAVSVVTALVCLLLIWRGRPARPLLQGPPEAASLEAIASYEGARPGPVETALTAAAATLFGLLVLPPSLALALGAIAVVACRVPSSRRVLLVTSPLLALLSGAYVVLNQLVREPAPGIAWAHDQAAVHLVSLFAVLVLALDAAVVARWRDREVAADK